MQFARGDPSLASTRNVGVADGRHALSRRHELRLVKLDEAPNGRGWRIQAAVQVAQHLAHHVEAAVVHEWYPADTAAVALVRCHIGVLLHRTPIDQKCHEKIDICFTVRILFK